MKYSLGAASRRELLGVHPDLVLVVQAAIARTSQDFAVHDGLRTAAEQAEMYRRGASELDGVTKLSRHQTGHAVDLVPYVNGKLRWEWELIYPIADAVRAAAEEAGIPIRWGGAWEFLLTGPEAKGFLAKGLHARHKGWDGPHFELPRSVYP